MRIWHELAAVKSNIFDKNNNFCLSNQIIHVTYTLYKFILLAKRFKMLRNLNKLTTRKHFSFQVHLGQIFSSFASNNNQN